MLTPAQSQLAEAHRQLVTKQVRKFLGTRPHLKYLKDDLEGTGELALCNAATTVDADKNPAAYFRTAITNAIDDFANESDSLGASNRTQRRSLDNSLPKEFPVDDDVLKDTLAAPDHSAADELRELIVSCCRDHVDREIIRLKEYGEKPPAIAEQLGISLSTFYNRLNALEERFDEKRSEL